MVRDVMASLSSSNVLPAASQTTLAFFLEYECICNGLLVDICVVSLVEIDAPFILFCTTKHFWAQGSRNKFLLKPQIVFLPLYIVKRLCEKVKQLIICVYTHKLMLATICRQIFDLQRLQPWLLTQILSKTMEAFFYKKISPTFMEFLFCKKGDWLSNLFKSPF